MTVHHGQVCFKPVTWRLSFIIFSHFLLFCSLYTQRCWHILYWCTWCFEQDNFSMWRFLSHMIISPHVFTGHSHILSSLSILTSQLQLCLKCSFCDIGYIYFIVEKSNLLYIFFFFFWWVKNMYKLLTCNGETGTPVVYNVPPLCGISNCNLSQQLQINNCVSII